MAVLSLTVESLIKGQQDPLGGQLPWTQRRDALTCIVGSAAKPARPTVCLVAYAPSAEGHRPELSWRHFFSDSILRCSIREQHAELPRVDAVDMQMGCRAGYKRAVSAETLGSRRQEGQLAEAVEALGVLVRTGFHVSQSDFYTVLKQCLTTKDLLLGRRVHALSLKNGRESDTFLCNHILRMYASHAKLQEAIDVFNMVARPDAFTWSAIISAHVEQGQGKQAIELYHRMRKSSVKADGHVFVAALQACAKHGDLKTGQQVHSDLLATGVEHHLVVWNCLVDMYAKCGSLADAQKVFDCLGEKDVVTWNAMIAGYSQQGMGKEALNLYSVMQGGMAEPDSVTFACLLQACASAGTLGLEKGEELHAQIRERGLQANVFVGSSLVNMYAKCGSLEDARVVFDGLGQKNVVTWSAMIAGYSQQGLGLEALHLYRIMEGEGKIAPNSVTFVGILQACGSVGPLALETGKEFHAQIREQGFEADVCVASSLVDMYAKCGSIEDARVVFDKLPQKEVVTWNAMIAGYSHKGLGQEALWLFRTMANEGMAVPNSVTFVCLLQACASIGAGAWETGKQLHAQIREQGLQTEALVVSSLLTMYAKCGSLEAALHLYRALQDEGTSIPASVAFPCLLQACASVGSPALEKGRHLHAQLKKLGHQADVLIDNSLINMYAKCGCLEDAQRVFDGLDSKDVVTWTTLIAGYSQQGMGQEALHLHSAMEEGGTAGLDSVTFVCLLQACVSVGALALEKGKQLHGQIKERGLQTDAVVASSLVNMYAKCGSLKDAQGVFDILLEKNVVTWTALIAGYSHQGLNQEAIRLYLAMQAEGTVTPDSVTFVCLLQACASVAALHLGRQLHAEIKEQGLELDLSVASSLIDMYSKSGSMVDAQQVFDALPRRDVVIWSALIAGYTCQGQSEKVFDLFQLMTVDGIQPDSITFLSVLTVCSHTGLLEKGQEYFEVMTRHYGITPTVEHYTCMVDLLGRQGRLDESLALVRSLPVVPNAPVWHTLLGACRTWSNVEVGLRAFDEALKLDKNDAAAFVLMSSIYAGAEMWEQARKMQARRKGIGAWKQPGQSWWTDMDGLVHSFCCRG